MKSAGLVASWISVIAFLWTATTTRYATVCCAYLPQPLVALPRFSSRLSAMKAAAEPGRKLVSRRLSRDERSNRDMPKNSSPKNNGDGTKYRITTKEELDAYFRDDEGRFRKKNGETDYKALLNALDVRGDTQIIGAPDRPDYTHPVAQLLHKRKQRGSSEDGFKVALAIEGGGMRGCVSAGMVCAIHHLNLTSAFDVVYGSSAGTIVGSYLITGQMPWFGPELYYDRLTTAGKNFIDTRRLLRALGLGILDPRLIRDVLTRPDYGKPVLNLPFLLKTTMQETKPLDWQTFREKQKELPLKVVVSGLKSEKSIVLDYDKGSFETLSELTDCMHASCLLPGIAGPVMNMDLRAVGKNKQSGLKKYVVGNNLAGDHYEPLADALLYEPFPYRSAVAEGATHVVVLRSRPVRVLVLRRCPFEVVRCAHIVNTRCVFDRMEMTRLVRAASLRI